jgi:hypothetical protein
MSAPMSAKMVRVRHRLEQLAGRPAQHVDRQEARDDHRHRVEDRPFHLGRGRNDGVDDAQPFGLRVGQSSIDVLDHDDRAVDENAEVDRTDGEQVRRNAPEVETDEREQQRQRNRHRDDEPRTDVVQEEDENHHDQHDAAQQVVLDRARRQANQIAAVVERNDLHVLRQDLLVELRRLRSIP